MKLTKLVRVLILISAILAVLFLVYLQLVNSGPVPAEQDQKPKVILAGQVVVEVEVANTEIKRIRGLSGRLSLGAGEGMLFVFDNPGRYGFWMPDMNFPLDFIWIENGVIVDLTKNVSNKFDPKNPKIYYPRTDISQVLEVNAGFIARHQLKIGDKVETQNIIAI